MNNDQQNILNLVTKAAPVSSETDNSIFNTQTHDQQTLATKSLAPKQAAVGSQGVLPKLWGNVETVGKEVAHLGNAAIHGVAHAAVDTVTSFPKFGKALSDMSQNNSQLNDINNEINASGQRLQNLFSDYKAGKISRADYGKGLKEINDTNKQLTLSANATQTAVSKNGEDLYKSGTTAAATTIALLSAGTAVPLEEAVNGGVSKAVTYLAQDAGPIGEKLLQGAAKMEDAVNFVAHIADRFQARIGSSVVDEAIAKSAAEAGATATAEMTSKQIAKNAAVNLLIKRPLIYQTNIGAAHDIYTDLSSGKYGAAVGNVALLTAMTFKGGPIGWAHDILKSGSGAVAGALGNVTERSLEGYIQAIKDGAKFGMDNGVFKTTTQAMFGQKTVMEELSKLTGDGSKDGIFKVLASAVENGDTKLVEDYKVMEEMNLRRANGNPVTAAHFIADWYDQTFSKDLTTTHEKFLDHLATYNRDYQAIVEAAKAGKVLGVSPADAERIVLGRGDTALKYELSNALKAVDEAMGQKAPISTAVQYSEKDIEAHMALGATREQAIASLSSETTSSVPSTFADVVQERQAAVQKLIDDNPQRAAFSSHTFMNQVNTIIATEQDTGKMIKRLNSMGFAEELAGVPKDLKEQLAKNGHMVVLPQKTFQKYVSYADVADKSLASASKGVAQTEQNLAQKGLPSVFDEAAHPVPILSSVGAVLQKMGLSPADSGTAVQRTFKTNFAASLDESLLTTGVSRDESASTIMNKLASYAKDSQTLKNRAFPVTDFRQFTDKEIGVALGISKEQAKNVSKSLMQSMLSVPVELRGLGDKIMDLNYKFNPLAGGYARVQAAGKFYWNPFFKSQHAVQTEILSQLESGGKFPTLGLTDKFVQQLFPERYATLDKTVGELRSAGIFGRITQGYVDEGATSNAVGAIGARLGRSQERSLAGLVQVAAEKVGVDVPTYVNEYRQEVTDMLRTLVSYPKGNNYLNSPLARTLNVMFYPSRYNTKVAGLMAEHVAKLDPVTQVALIKGMFNMSKWMKSDEGVAWQVQNADVINIMKYFTPLYSLGAVSKILSGNAESISDYGQIGGLPFGFITQLLDSEGITNFNKPYLDPKTGNPLPDYVPKTDAARLNLAIQDLLGSVFTYPGATLGLPSKSSILRTVGNAVPGSKNQFEKVDTQNQLSPSQLNEQRVIQQNQPTYAPSGQQLKPFKDNVAPTEINVPENRLPRPQALPNMTKSQAQALKGSSRKLKKSNFRPAPLT
jgi:hypothetical protein